MSTAQFPESFPFARHYSDQPAASDPAVPRATSIETDPNSSNGRQCSVRGCNKSIPGESANRMCGTCRTRHRTYANTKRAKRKMEKATVPLQTLGQLDQGHVSNTFTEPTAAWMPGVPVLNGQESPQGSTPSNNSLTNANGDDSVLPGTRTTNATKSFSPASSASWLHNALDPRLFSNTSSSALAGALTLPSQTARTSHRTSSQSPSLQPNLPPAANTHSPRSPSRESASSAVADPDAPAPAADPTASPEPPPRFCSVKGCKATVPGNYFFKMCIPCRDRYRAYGTTKRAKWKRERAVANTTLEKAKEDEDKRRAAAGLPALADSTLEEYRAWESTLTYDTEKSPFNPHPDLPPQTKPLALLPARMCTVSHCHKILQGDYKFRRCEAHRKQNRYHSNLKRVREKERKAHGPVGEDVGWKVWPVVGEEMAPTNDDLAIEPLISHQSIVPDSDSMGGGHLSHSEMTGVHPGIQRTNHVCSVKACFNLLAPDVPWKMCDGCRSHDRIIRQNRRIRDNAKLASKANDQQQTCRNVTAGAIDGTSFSNDEQTESNASVAEKVLSKNPQDLFINLLVPEDLAATANCNPSTVGNGAANVAITSTTSPETCNISSEAPHSRTRKKRAKVGSNDKQIQQVAALPAPSATAVSAPSTGSYPYGSSFPPPYPYAYPYYIPPFVPPYSHPQQPQQPSSSPSKTMSASGNSSQPPYNHPPFPPYPYAYPPPYPQPPYPYQYPPPSYPYAPMPTKPHSQVQSSSKPGPVQAPFCSMDDPKFYTPNNKQKRRKLIHPKEVGTTEVSTGCSTVTPGPAFFGTFSTPSGPPAGRDVQDDTASSASTNGPTTLQSALTAGASERQRSCSSKGCHRTIPQGTSITICERCRRRMKKHQAKVKQRFKLEPRKGIAQTVSEDLEEGADHEEVVSMVNEDRNG